MDDGNGPGKSSSGDPHPVATGEEPSVGVAGDLGARVEDLDVGEVSDLPPSVDEPPAQFDLLVPVEELGEVTADLFIRLTTDRGRTTKEVGHITGLGWVSPSSPGNVAA